MILGGKLGIAAGDLAPSTSPVYAAQGLPDGNDWAVGGYRTDQIYDSITAAGGSVVSAGGQTRTRDGYLVGLASQGLRADPNALYYLTGGGNDFLQGRITNTVTAQAAAGRLVDSVQALQQAGARYIMVWLLPDLGYTPAIYGGALQSTASQLSNAFNQQLVSELQGERRGDPAEYPGAGQGSAGRSGAIRPGPPAQNLIGTCFSGNGCTMNPRRQRQHARSDQVAVQRRRAPDHRRPAGDRRLRLLDPLRALGNHPAAGNGQWHPARLPGRTAQPVAGGLGALAGRRPVAQLRQRRRPAPDFDDQHSGASGDGWGANLTLGGSYRLDEAWRVGWRPVSPGRSWKPAPPIPTTS
jgi:outer membrane lipase/esterase